MPTMVSAAAAAATTSSPTLGLVVAAVSGAPLSLAVDLVAQVAVPVIGAIPGGAEHAQGLRIPVGAEELLEGGGVRRLAEALGRGQHRQGQLVLEREPDDEIAAGPPVPRPTRRQAGPGRPLLLGAQRRRGTLDPRARGRIGGVRERSQRVRGEKWRLW